MPSFLPAIRLLWALEILSAKWSILIVTCLAFAEYSAFNLCILYIYIYSKWIYKVILCIHRPALVRWWDRKLRSASSDFAWTSRNTERSSSISRTFRLWTDSRDERHGRHHKGPASWKSLVWIHLHIVAQNHCPLAQICAFCCRVWLSARTIREFSCTSLPFSSNLDAIASHCNTVSCLQLPQVSTWNSLRFEIKMQNKMWNSETVQGIKDGNRIKVAE